MLLMLETRLIFPGAVGPKNLVQPPEDLAIDELALPSKNGETIQAWITIPKDWKPTNGAILFSHGNGSNISYCVDYARLYKNFFQTAVLLYGYPGYGKSTGRPTESGCYAAAEAAFGYLTTNMKVEIKNIILVGDSLGGAMATDLASRYHVRGLVTVNTFTSIPDVARFRFPIFPTQWFVRTQFQTLAKIKNLTSPVFITHGTSDQVIPYFMGEKLFAAAPMPKHFFPREGESHRHPVDQAFFTKVKDFFDRTSRDNP